MRESHPPRSPTAQKSHDDPNLLYVDALALAEEAIRLDKSKTYHAAATTYAECLDTLAELLDIIQALQERKGPAKWAKYDELLERVVSMACLSYSAYAFSGLIMPQYDTYSDRAAILRGRVLEDKRITDRILLSRCASAQKIYLMIELELTCLWPSDSSCHIVIDL